MWIDDIWGFCIEECVTTKCFYSTLVKAIIIHGWLWLLILVQLGWMCMSVIAKEGGIYLIIYGYLQVIVSYHCI